MGLFEDLNQQTADSSFGKLMFPFASTTTPMKNQDPGNLSMESDPWKIKGRDQNGLRNLMMSRIQKQGAANTEQALASQQRAGMSGSDLGRSVENIAGEQASAQGELELMLADKDFQERMAMMDALNKAKEAEYNSKYGRYADEQKQKNLMTQLMGQAGGSIAGGIIGGKK